MSGFKKTMNTNGYNHHHRVRDNSTERNGHTRGDLTPELVANEIIDEMKKNRRGSNPVDSYLKDNRLGLEQSTGNFTTVSSTTSSVAAMPTKKIVDQEREDHIRYTLDMVVHHLISQGQLNPALSYKLNTPKMREHIGRMVDQISRRHAEEETVQMIRTLESSSSLGVTESFIERNGLSSYFRPKVTPELPVKTKNAKKAKSTADKKSIASSLNATAKANSTFTSLGTTTRTRKSTSKGIADALGQYQSYPSTAAVRMKPAISTDNNSLLLPPSTSRASARYRRGGYAPPLPSAAISFTSKQMLDEMDLLSPERLAKFPNFQAPRKLERAPVQAYRTKIDLSGFKDEHITLDLKGRRLTIDAVRPKGMNNSQARKISEVIEIPEGIHFENLEIGRRGDGALWIEEVIPESNTNVYESFRRHPYQPKVLELTKQ